jgi:hypothetical protein
MKKFFVLRAAAVVLLSMVGCASTSGRMSRGLSGVPDFVNEAYLNASEDVIIGIGTDTLQVLRLSQITRRVICAISGQL